MAELRGQLEASHSIVRTFDARIVGLQARLAAMEARASSKSCTLLFIKHAPVLFRSLFLLLRRAVGGADEASSVDRHSDSKCPRPRCDPHVVLA
jgi:hypothetical protein